MYVTILLIQVCTTLQRALLRGDSARIRILTTVVGPRQGSLAMDNRVSYGQLCRGEWETRAPLLHRPHDVTNHTLCVEPLSL